MKLTNKTYDVLKIISMIIVPLAALVTSLGDIWGLPYAEQISNTLLAIGVFLGALLVDSSKRYTQAQEENDEEVVHG